MTDTADEVHTFLGSVNPKFMSQRGADFSNFPHLVLKELALLPKPILGSSPSFI
jgi:hypothetical protein